MAGGGVVEVDGARQLRKALKATETGLDDLKAVHGQVAALVTNTASGRTPRRSGTLAGTVRGTGTKTMATTRAGFAAVPYANPIHWGWFSHHIQDNPWITRAASETEPVWTEMYAVGVQGLINVSIQRNALTQ